MESEEEEIEQEEEEVLPESGFSQFLREQMEVMPWWVLSAVIHVSILGILLLFANEEEQPKAVKIELQARLQPEPTEELKPEEKVEQPLPQEKPVPPQSQPEATEILETADIPEIADTSSPPSTGQDFVIKEGKISDHTETANQENFRMSKGTPGGISDSPFEGKFTSRKINVGIGGGGGGGMFGDRFGGKENLVSRRGGSKKTESAVNAGLQWLKRHQSYDGSWKAQGFTQCCNTDPKYTGTCDGAGAPWVDPGVTGLALLCFLGAGNSTSQGDFKDQVKKGVQYLTQIQDNEGCFGPQAGNYMYNHAIATLAMAEAYSLSNYNALLKTPAQKGVDFLIEAQNPNQGWRYIKRSKDNDTSVTGWCIMALKSAKTAGLTMPDTSFVWAKNFLDSVTETSYYRTGYTEKNKHAGIQECMTAVAMTARVFMGAEKNDPYLIGGAGLLQTNLPAWQEGKGLDYYYWYYGTLAMYQMGGEQWNTWNEKMKEALLDHQEKSGCAHGSWPAKDTWSSTGGRIYATTLNVLSMEIYYRYAKVFK